MTDERINGTGGWLASHWQLLDPEVYPAAPAYLFDAAQWPRQDGQAGAGRGSAAFVGDDTGDYVLRHYRRGGMIAALSRDRYVATGALRSRAFREWRLLAALRQRGLPVPEPVAAQYRRSGVLYTADLLTRRIPTAETLAARLTTAPIDAGAWTGLGRLLARFHAHGACHADLNAHNIVLDGGGRWYLLDFDRGSLQAPGDWCVANLARLRRSLDKLAGLHGGLHFTASDWDDLERGYASFESGDTA